MIDNLYRRFLWLVVGSALWGMLTPGAVGQPSDSWQSERNKMVDDEIVAAGVSNVRVIDAMRTVPRHEFVTPDQRRYAYCDMCLPIGSGQTISPPFMVAMMTERLDLQPTDRILEVGTGSGYQSAVLSRLVQDVYTIEIVEALGRRSAATLRRLRCDNVHPRTGDGYAGWPQYAPFDKIIVTCSPTAVPQALVDQLKEGGRMIVPVGERFQQTLYLFEKRGGKLVKEAIEPTMFVPMTGAGEDDGRRNRAAGDQLVNGDFEEPSRFAERPEGWYYARQAKVEALDEAPAGKNCLTITNREPGRHGQVLQAVGVDGRQTCRLDIDFWVRTASVKAGPSIENQAMLLVTFFDEERSPLGQAMVGPWSGSMPWTRQQGRLNVPRSARFAVVAIGLLGATGEISFDDIRSKAVPAKPVALLPGQSSPGSRR
ncbi:MAG TPA: protein-L-isoaspartate(D-aspartate) O-methyltransferase [Pirellulales bacterium]|nr:protein-L-isoaspartate(D-aspartate) O-methyltransferase [Pirellulales bacterium]